MGELGVDPTERRAASAQVLRTVVRAGRRRRAGGAALGIAVVTAVLGGLLVLPRSQPTEVLAVEPSTTAGPVVVAPLVCPVLTAEPTAPASTYAFDAAASLVPMEVPAAVDICRYGRVDTPGAAQGHVRLTGSLDRVPGDLDVTSGPVSRACTLIGGGKEQVRVALSYRSGAQVWLSAEVDPNSCTPVGNGVFTSRVYVADELVAAYDAGSWAPGPAGTSCGAANGRAGEERALVPPGWTTATVCVDGGPGRELSGEAARQVAALLAGLPTATGNGTTCDRPVPVAGARDMVSVEFGYRTGRTVRITVVPWCTTTVTNGPLNGLATEAQQSELLRLLG